MNGYKFWILFPTIIFSFPTLSIADQQGISITERQNERLIITNLQLTGSDFWSAYQSSDLQQRRLAEMYLAGVLDSTEGKSWCSYKVVHPGSIQEQIFIGFKKQSAENLKDRASKIITNMMEEFLPCRSKK